MMRRRGRERRRHRSPRKQNNAYIKSEWSSLKEIAFKLITKPQTLENYNEFIVNAAKSNDRNEEDGIYKYNTIKNTWSKLTNCNKWRKSNHICYKQKNTLYIVNKHANIIKICLNNNKINKMKLPYHFGNNSECIMISNNIHIIGDSFHHIWNTETGEIRTLHQLNAIKCTPKLIYIETKQMIFMFGGINIYDIYSYSVGHNKWIKLQTKLPLQIKDNFGIISTNDDKFIVLFGGCDDKIHIFNLETFELKESSLKCPTKGMFKATISNNQLALWILINGYIRSLKAKYVPMDVINLIHSMCSVKEYVHLIQFGDVNCCKHWRIELNKIIK